MKLLYLTHRCPYPPNKGERIRCFNVLKHLAQCHDLTLAYPIFSAEEATYTQTLRQYAQLVLTVPIRPLLAQSKCLFGLCSRRPLTLSYFYSSKLQHIIQNRAFDLVLADCSSMAQYVIGSKKPKIVDFVDIDSDKWQAYARDAKPPKSFIYNMEYRRLSLFEDRVTQTFDYCLVVSEEEKKLLKYEKNVVVMPNGIDCQFFTPRAEQNPNVLIFTGAMDYFPNIDGVSYFHREIWPLVKAQQPDVRFVVAGMQPHARIKALASDEVLITGYVPDIRDSLVQATVCVVPLRIAKGIQNKVLEAMAMGIPVVATRAANTGIHAQDGQQILLADSPQEFARAIMLLLHDVQLRRTIAANARQFVQDHFSWEKHLGTLDTLIERLTHKHP